MAVSRRMRCAALLRRPLQLEPAVQEIGRPVRMQWMRDEETAWDTKGPAFLVKTRGALDAQGRVIAYDYNARACDYNHSGYNEADTYLAAQLMGIRKARPAAGGSSLPS